MEKKFDLFDLLTRQKEKAEKPIPPKVKKAAEVFVSKSNVEWQQLTTE